MTASRTWSGFRGGLLQKHGHLAAGARCRGTVVAAAAASRDALGGELLDPVGVRRRARDVVEDPLARGRHVVGAVLGLQQQDRGVLAGERALRAEEAAAAA